jgi:hypothetical protein
MATVQITAVRLKGPQSEGYYVDGDGIRRSVYLQQGEAIRITQALDREGHDSVAFDLGDDSSPAYD